MKIIASVLLLVATAWISVLGDSSVNESNCCAYAANAGWIDLKADRTNGAVIGEFVCSNYLYGANIGWIHLGEGSPTNGIHYSNMSTDDYGVNHDGKGGLYGCAYGANVGWILFETNYGRPRVDLLTGSLQGYVFSGNLGWISLSNAEAFVQTDFLASGPDTDGDGMPDQWELSKVSSLTTLTVSGDYDQDGVLDREEYPPDTNPADISRYLRVTDIIVSSLTNVTVVWASEPTRLYMVQANSNLTHSATWTNCMAWRLPRPGTNVSLDLVEGTVSSFFYRVAARRPLAD